MNHERIQQNLLMRRNELLARLPAHARASDGACAPGRPDPALGLENLDVLFLLDVPTRRELQQLNNALQRLESGEYNDCVRCGSPIGKSRLATQPCTDLCHRCAR